MNSRASAGSNGGSGHALAWKCATEEGSQSREEETSSSSEVVRDNGVAVDDVLRGEMVPTFVVRSLAEVAPLLEKHFALRAE